ncbi:MAG: hypothetical protein KatS3mg093_089 [Candidatus Parcubacteria bacterium]|nr:MAG: hypothetical protein KatS3mg093_089 [Candidatus Parcubacteria bacterium]
METIFKEIIKNFNDREQDLIKRRYGLNGEKETLESIGKSYNITRERVRQIQKNVDNKLKNLINNHPKIKETFENVKNNHLGQLGIKKEKNLFLSLKIKEGLNDEHLKIFRFFSIFYEKIIYHEEDNFFHGFFCQDKKIYFKFKNWLNEIYSKFTQENYYLPEEELLKLTSEEIKKKLRGKTMPVNEIIETLTIIKHLAKNPFNFWGLKNHNYISPKRLKEKIIVILKHKNQPLHFSHIYKILTEFKSSNHDSLSYHWKKTYNLCSIKNELIRSKDFILVGRGTYALREWNMQEGKAKELLVKFIKEKGKITREELWQMISSLRQIKKQTFNIYLNELKKMGLKEQEKYLSYHD